MSILVLIWKRWRKIGQQIGDFVGRLIMTIFYFTIAAPFGLAVRFFSDPLKLKPHRPNWETRPTEQPTLEDARRAY